MAEEQLVLVDECDREVGTAGKLECHVGSGRLHRAFTALVMDETGRLLLTRRSGSKMLWPAHWDATFASHPRAGEPYAHAGVRRMPEETGASCEMDYLFKFVYRAEYLDVGTENEVCGTLIGTLGADARLEPAPSEISELAWEDAVSLARAVGDNARPYCPWMLAALWLLGEAPRSDALSRHGAQVAPWTDSDVRDAMLTGVRAHMADGTWRMVAE